MSKVDQMDLAILGFLQENGENSHTELNVRVGTIRTRIKRMIQGEVFEFKLSINPTKFEMNVQAFIGISIELGIQETLANILLQYKEVTYVGSYLGKHQLLIKVHFHSNEELEQFIF
jgi:Lrp/AsnC family transcriptional regulator for asnA, asnC and gidA